MEEKAYLDINNCRTVGDIILRAGELYKEKDAYRFERDGEQKHINFGEFASDYRAVCAYLRAEGFEGSHFAIIANNDYEWILSYVSALEVGVAVPVSLETDEKEAAYLREKGDINAIFASNEELGLFGDNIRAIDIDTMDEIIRRGNALIAAGKEGIAHKDDKRLCEILFTSGTTGAKRGVMLNNANLLAIIKSPFPELIGSVTLSALPFSHGFEAVCHILASLAPGVTVCIAKSVMRYATEMVKYQPQSVYLVPMQAASLLGVFAGAFEKCKDNLETIVCGGAAINTFLYESFAGMGIRLLAGYGLSECSPLVSLNTQGVLGASGRPAPYCEVKISEIGEILVRGENVMSGYYKDEEATKAAFDEQGWLKTGDLGSMSEDGDIFITGRIKNLIVLPNGENIIPEEVEEVLSGFLPKGTDMIVFEKDGKLCAEMFAGELSESEAMATLKAAVDEANMRLASFKRIAGIYIRKEPYNKTALGKIKRR